ncbi:M20/M25/M40 family metallo-hydrolase [Rhizorhabdus dicambivorans]|uniref:Peptidase M20 n=1 Tax=Rhizorhabdus dicambivorans TaxID=1850238 RepID=A0A2A4FS43_9SPHN|nr:M20/M25/M40 family metallo-hydrolase [Rhizorhabdus dicambivorans]ATE65654.1 peptidase M20 [Rhizorhabdus dicambivorans]PCE40997.1 peptidase M20 [Rhizorhabdus dicambivorans]
MSKNWRKLVACVLCATAPLPALAALDKAESRMVQVIDAERGRTIGLLEALVNVNSGSRNLPGVAKVGQMMRAELEPLGFTVRWVPMEKTGRAGHIVAVHKGDGRGKRLLLIGHLDTVFEPDSPFQAWTLKGKDAEGRDWAEGPGAGDDKGGMAVIVAALRAMKAAGTLGRADIEIVLTGDEEDSGDPIELARADLIAAGKRADIALDFEGLAREDGRDMGSIARRSSNSWTVRASGNTGHSSGIFGEKAGYGAIYELARIIDRFRRELPETNLTYNVGLIAGGATQTTDPDGIRMSATGKTNIIPPVAVARGDMRTLSDEQTARVRQKMAAIVADHLPGTNAEIAFDKGGYPAMAPTQGNRAILDRLNAVNRDLGLPEMPPLDPLKRGAGDISFVARDVDSYVGMGSYSTGDHAPGERVDLTSIPLQAKRAAILMTRLSGERRAPE